MQTIYVRKEMCTKDGDPEFSIVLKLLIHGVRQNVDQSTYPRMSVPRSGQDSPCSLRRNDVVMWLKSLS